MPMTLIRNQASDLMIIDAVHHQYLTQEQAREIESLAPGQRLALCFPNDGRLAQALLLAYDRGIVCVPINPNLPQHERDYILEHSQAHALLSADEGLRLLQRTEDLSPAEDRFIIYTSGSTGAPKGVVLTKTAVEDNAQKTAELHGFGPGNTHVTCLPLYHCNALVMSLIGHYLAGGKLVLESAKNIMQLFATANTYKASTISVVPAIVYDIVASRPVWPESLNYLITAAAPLNVSLSRDFYALYGPKLRQGYGLTEAVNFSCVMPLLQDADFQQEYLASHPPVGVPLKQTSLRIKDGEVQVRGKNLMRCYWRNEDATRDAFTDDGWLHTGDCGYLRNGYLVLDGRHKESINRGGETIYPIAVEEEYRSRGLHGKFAVCAIDDLRLTHEIGLWTEQFDPAFWTTIGEGPYKIAALQTGPLLETSTHKPQRNKMGHLLVSRSLSALNTDQVPFATIAEHELQTLLEDFLSRRVPQEQTHWIRFNDVWTSLGQEYRNIAAFVWEGMEDTAVLESLYESLPAGGFFVCAHLNHAIHDKAPAMDRRSISAALINTGFSNWGFSRLRAGKDDLGGLVWGYKV